MLAAAAGGRFFHGSKRDNFIKNGLFIAFFPQNPAQPLDVLANGGCS
jgi:hypothetical protein